MDVRMPDGSVIKGVPDGTSKEEILAKYEQSRRPAFEREAEQIKNTSLLDLVSGSAPGRFVGGVADPFIGLMQLGSRVVGGSDYMDRVVKEREERARRGDLAYGREGFDWIRTLGNVMNPVGIKAGAVAPKGALGRVGLGAGLGTAFGLSAPVEDTENFATKKATQGALGAGLGALVPGAIEGSRLGLKVGKHVLEPVFKSGRQAIKGREYLNAAGDKADDILGLLQNPDELVPGSLPTAGEAAVPAGRAEFAALQRVVSGNKPSDYLARSKAQDAARVASIRGFSGTKEDLNTAITTRDSNAAINYAKAFLDDVKVDNDLVQMSKTPPFQTAVRDASAIAVTDGFSPKQEPVRFLHMVKLSLDKQLNAAGDNALGSAQKKSVQGLRQRLLGWLEKNAPDYETARAQYAADSGPINRMRIGQELENTLTQPVSDIAETGTQRVGPFSSAMRDSSRIIKKTGQDPRFNELSDILKPDEMTRVTNVAKDLARRAQFEEQARAGLSTQKGNITARQLERETGGSTSPNALSRPVMIFNALMNRIQGKAGGELMDEMALEMLDPKVVAAALKKAMVPAERSKKFMEALNRAMFPATAGAATEAALGVNELDQ